MENRAQKDSKEKPTIQSGGGDRSNMPQDVGSHPRATPDLKALSRLASGLSHDLGNILMVLQVNLSTMARERFRKSEISLIADMRACLNELEAMKAALDQMTTEGGPQLQSVDFSQWWSSLEPLLQMILPSGVMLRSQLERDLARVLMSPHEVATAVVLLVADVADGLRAEDRVNAWTETAPDRESLELLIEIDAAAEARPTARTWEMSSRLLASAGAFLGRQADRAAAIQIRIPTCGGDSERAAPEKIAIISLEDERVAAYLATLLSSSGFLIRYHEPYAVAENVEGAALWIADNSTASIEEARAFLRQHPFRQMVVWGDVNGTWRHTGARCVRVAEGLAGARIAIRKALEAFDEAKRQL